MNAHYENVGASFRTNFIRLAVICTFWVVSWASPWFLRPKQYIKLFNLSTPCGCLWLICWILLWFQRYAHSGVVCSGMYLETEDYEKDPDIELKYMVESGMFIKFIWWVYFIIIVLGCFGFTLIGLVKLYET